MYPPLPAVDRVPDVPPATLLLHPVRGEDGQLGQDQLGQLGNAADRQPDQPKARRMREKKLPPSPWRERRLCASRVSPSFSASSRCSSGSPSGTIPWPAITMSPGGPPLAPGIP